MADDVTKVEEEVTTPTTGEETSNTETSNEEETIDTSTQIGKLKIKIPYDEKKFTTKAIYEETLNNLLEDSKNIALANIYPFKDWSTYELPDKYKNWQIRAAVELYKFDKFIGIRSYSENGMSFSRDSENLSQSLLDELIPQAGIPKRKEESEDETDG